MTAEQIKKFVGCLCEATLKTKDGAKYVYTGIFCRHDERSGDLKLSHGKLFIQSADSFEAQRKDYSLPLSDNFEFRFFRKPKDMTPEQLWRLAERLAKDEHGEDAVITSVNYSRNCKTRLGYEGYSDKETYLSGYVEEDDYYDVTEAF